MKNNVIKTIIISIAMLFVFNINAYGLADKTCNTYDESYACKMQISMAEDKDILLLTQDIIVENQEESTTSGDTAPKCSGVFAGFESDLQEIMDAIRIIAPLLVLVLSVIEYISAVTSKSADGLKKANGRLVKRLILMVVLFILPSFINVILGFFLGPEYNTCVDLD